MSERNGHRNGTAARGVDRLTSAFAATDPDKMPPHSIEAELACLGTMLRDDNNVEIVAAIVRAEDFFRESHALIFRRIIRIHQEGIPVDPIILANDLKEIGYWEKFDGNEFLREAVDAGIQTGNAAHYAHVVKRKAEYRGVIELATDVRRRAYSQQELPDSLLGEIGTRIDVARERIADPDESESESTINPLPEKMGAAAFAGVLGEIVQVVSRETEACPEAILAQFLVAFGNAIGRKAHWIVGASVHRANLFLCLTGPTGSARKGTAWDIACWLIHQCDPEWRDPINGLTSGEGLIRWCRDHPGPLLAVEEEFARLLCNGSREHSNLSPVLRDAFAGKTLYVPKAGEPITLEDHHISIIGHITYTELEMRLHRVEIDNGLANRFMWLHSYSARDLPEGGDIFSLRQILNPLIGDLAHSLRWGRTDEGLSVIFKRDSDARDYWRDIYHDLKRPRPGAYGAVVQRSIPIVMRLAMIYAILDRDFYIKKRHLESALAFWRYCDRTAAYIFGDPIKDANLTKLIKAIETAPEGLTRSEIRNKVFKSHLSVQDLDRLLDQVHSSGLIEIVKIKTSGRSRDAWVHKKFADLAPA